MQLPISHCCTLQGVTPNIKLMKSFLDAFGEIRRISEDDVLPMWSAENAVEIDEAYRTSASV